MAALTATVPTANGTTSAGAAVASTDTIAASVMGHRGVLLEIINGNASPDVVAITDAGNSPAGNPAANVGSSVANASSKVFKILREQVNPSTQVVTVTHTVTATVTYKLYPF